MTGALTTISADIPGFDDLVEAFVKRDFARVASHAEAMAYRDGAVQGLQLALINLPSGRLCKGTLVRANRVRPYSPARPRKRRLDWPGNRQGNPRFNYVERAIARREMSGGVLCRRGQTEWWERHDRKAAFYHMPGNRRTVPRTLSCGYRAEVPHGLTLKGSHVTEDSSKVTKIILQPLALPA